MEKTQKRRTNRPRLEGRWRVGRRTRPAGERKGKGVLGTPLHRPLPSLPPSLPAAARRLPTCGLCHASAGRRRCARALRRLPAPSGAAHLGRSRRKRRRRRERSAGVRGSPHGSAAGTSGVWRAAVAGVATRSHPASQRGAPPCATAPERTWRRRRRRKSWRRLKKAEKKEGGRERGTGGGGAEEEEEDEGSDGYQEEEKEEEEVEGGKERGRGGRE